jgi:cell division transport system ATP-binding protein
MGRQLVGIRRKEIPMLRREIGIVFQDFQLLTDRTVYNNLKFVLDATGWRDKIEIDDRIEEVLKQVGMQTKSYKMPHELSGGEQQRIVIARALLNRPKLILADEPTGNLDPETGQQIVDHLREIANQGTAVLMATHNMQLVEQYPARVLRCENKQLITSDN